MMSNEVTLPNRGVSTAMSPDQSFTLHRPGLERAGALSTSSRLKAWWLTSVRRWRIMQQTREPFRGLFGTMHYRRTWVLLPPQH